MKIDGVSAIEILDSRGRPTVLASCLLENGVRASASVPSGASTGLSEAIELRDGSAERFRGLGCLKAVANINDEINNKIAKSGVATQAELDEWLIALDGTPDKSRLGANATLAISLAYSRAMAEVKGVALFEYFAGLDGLSPKLPLPMINLFSGGKHGGGQTAIQDIQLVVRRASTMMEVLQTMYAIYYTAAERIERRYGCRLLRADEGGQAPPVQSSDDMFQEAVDAIEDAGYTPSDQVAITVDVAASHFFNGERYLIDGQELTTEGMIDKMGDWIKKYPIISIEDGLAENEWRAWSKFMQRVGGDIMILGDDLLCTNHQRIERAIHENAANSLLLKVNQIGTISEALKSYKLAKQQNWKVVISARSGETEDDWLADLAVGWAADYIKVGSITQSERLAKYNRLLVIESQYGLTL